MRRRQAVLWGALLLGLAVAYRPLFQGQRILGRDMFRLFIPDATFLLERLKAGELPLWNPLLRLGQPFAATMHSQAFYPPRVLCVLLAGPVLGLTLEQVLHAALAAVGTYLLCRRLRASPEAAALGGAAFGLSPLLTDLATQANVVGSAAWSGLLLASAVDLARRPRAASVAKLSAFSGLSLLAGSPETVLWQGLLAVLLVLALTRRASAGALAAGGMLGAFAVAGVTAIPALELARNSARGAALEDLLTWSVSFPQLLAMAWPHADMPRGAYFSQDQWFVVTVFLGTLPCAFAAASLRRSPRVWALAAGGLLLAALSLGANFPPAAWVLHRPPFVLFRYPAKYLVGTAFCIAVLAALGVDRAVALARRVRPGVGRAGAAVVAAVLLLVALAPVTALPVFRAGLQQGLPWVVVLLAGAAVLALAVPAGPRRSARLRRALVLLAGAELLAFHLLQVGFGWETPRRFTHPSALAEALPHPFAGRVSLPITDAQPSETESAADFIDRSRDALVPNLSMEEALPALEGYGAPEPARGDFLMSGRRAVFDLAGVAFYIRGGRAPYADLTQVPTPPGLPNVYRSATAFPPAWVVQRARVVPDGEALERARDAAEPTRSTAFLAEGEPLELPPCASKVAVARAGANALELAIDACDHGYLVISAASYPGWTAEVDGKPTPVLRADYGLRAVRVGPGSQSVVLRYRPASFLLGAALSGLSLLAMAWVALRAGGMTSPPRGL